ncbi:MAG: hypothetical protein EOM23_00515 [Candidatus Moranbacteria bacterium]|nr:hypothetical protein [Candidatus Moranbacteria bacterium]
MVSLSKSFKSRQEICLWLENHKADLEDQIGFRLNIISACDLGILAEIRDSRDLKIVCIPDFDLTRESLETIEGFVDGEIGSEKHIGAIVLAESIDPKLEGHIVTLKCKTKLFRIYLLDVDEKTNKPLFKEYSGVEMQRV